MSENYWAIYIWGIYNYVMVFLYFCNMLFDNVWFGVQAILSLMIASLFSTYLNDLSQIIEQELIHRLALASRTQLPLIPQPQPLQYHQIVLLIPKQQQQQAIDVSSNTTTTTANAAGATATSPQ